MIRTLILLIIMSFFKINLAIASSDKCDDGLLVVASGEAWRGPPKFSVVIRHDRGSWFSDIYEVMSARDTEFNEGYKFDEEPDWENICVEIWKSCRRVWVKGHCELHPTVEGWEPSLERDRVHGLDRERSRKLRQCNTCPRTTSAHLSRMGQ